MKNETKKKPLTPEEVREAHEKNMKMLGGFFGFGYPVHVETKMPAKPKKKDKGAK